MLRELKADALPGWPAGVYFVVASELGASRSAVTIQIPGFPPAG